MNSPIFAVTQMKNWLMYCCYGTVYFTK